MYMFWLLLLLFSLLSSSSSVEFDSLSCPKSVLQPNLTLTYFVSRLKLSRMDNVVSNLAKIVVYCQALLTEKNIKGKKRRLLGYYPIARPLYVDSARLAGLNQSSTFLHCPPPSCFKTHLTTDDLMDQHVCTEGNACALIGPIISTMYFLGNNNFSIMVNDAINEKFGQKRESESGHALVAVLVVLVASALMVGVAFYVGYKMLQIERRRSGIVVTNETRNAYYTSPSVAGTELSNDEERVAQYENVVVSLN